MNMPNANQEVLDAFRDLEIAWCQFDYAAPEFVDTAIYKLNAAISRFNAVYAGLKNSRPKRLDEPINRGKEC